MIGVEHSTAHRASQAIRRMRDVEFGRQSSESEESFETDCGRLCDLTSQRPKQIATPSTMSPMTNKRHFDSLLSSTGHFHAMISAC